MNSQTIIQRSLKDMLIEQTLLLEDIMDGEISESDENRIASLEITVANKVDAWIKALKNGGTLDQYKEEIKSRIEDLKLALKTLDDGRLKKLSYLNGLLTENNLERLDGNEFYMKKDVSVTHAVNLNDVEEDFRRYEFSGITCEEMNLLKHALEDMIERAIDADIAERILFKLNSATYKCGVKDLPDGHRALTKSIMPTVRFYKVPVKNQLLKRSAV